jgi:drug/metabolite transporter (DMT)-like permease
MTTRNKHIQSILQALLVTFLWSTSFIIIKKGLQEIPPLTFAGLRYFLAFIFLLPFLFFKEKKKELKTITWRDFLLLILLGIIFYSLTQGAQFLGLSLLPAVTVSLLLNITPLVVAFMAVFTIKEYPGPVQWFGILIFITGVLVFFSSYDNIKGNIAGFGVMITGVLANAGSAVLGRSINREGKLSPVTVTVISMGIGSLIILGTGLSIETFPDLDLYSIILILWLAVINTAFAFTLWNYTLKTLRAVESSIINGTMLIQITLLSYIFLEENITIIKAAGIIIVTAGAFLVQVRRNSRRVLRKNTAV